MGRYVEEDPGFRSYMAEVQRQAPLDREEEHALALELHRTNDQRIAHRLVTANLRFVVQIALGYRGYGIRVADLVEEGNVGLLEAVRRFDPTRNLRFMTYASYWVRAYILAHVLKQSTLVGIGTGPLQSKMFFRMARERSAITRALGDHASTEEIERRLAEKFGTTVERIREIGGRLDAKDVSLDAQVFRDGTTTKLEQLAAGGADIELDLSARERNAEIRRRLASVMVTLAPRERYIVDHRLMTDEEETLADIGRHLQLSRERVRQLETRIKSKLRRAMEGMEVPNAA